MDQKTAAQGVRTYAKNAAKEFYGVSEDLAEALTDGPQHIDVAYRLEAFLTARAKFDAYNDVLSLDKDGETKYDDAKLLDRIEDRRRTFTKWLLQSRSQNAGMHGVVQHHASEAARRFLSDTYFVDTIDDDNEEN